MTDRLCVVTAATDVISLDESQGFVNNSPFVNAIVKQALLTPAFIYSLENKTTTDFRYFANSVDVAVEDNIYHPAYDGVGLSELHLVCAVDLGTL